VEGMHAALGARVPSMILLWHTYRLTSHGPAGGASAMHTTLHGTASAALLRCKTAHSNTAHEGAA
jgi:hypothetical protein